MASAPSAGFQFSSPFTSVFNPAGKQHEKALKQAFYNTAAIVFVVLSGAIAVSVYYVLEAFIRPLVWAALCGTFLHPFKKTVTNAVRTWLQNMEENGTPLSIGCTILPFQILNKSSDMLGEVMRANYKLLLALFVFVPFSYYLIVYHPFYQIFFAVDKVVSVISKILVLFQQPLWVWSLLAGYVLVVVFWWSPSRNAGLHYLSIPVWIITLFHFASLAGSWRVVLALIIVVLLIAGFAADHREGKKNAASEDDETSPSKTSAIKSFVDRALVAVGVSHASPDSKDSSPSTSASELDLKSLDSETVEATPQPKPVQRLTPREPRKKKTKLKKRIGSSDPYFVTLFWLLVLSHIWIHPWILQFLPILLAIYILKTLLFYFSLDAILKEKLQPPINSVQIWSERRMDVILPGPVRAVFLVLFKGDRKILGWMHSSMDKLMSVCIIVCLILLATISAVFFVVQVHHESSYLVHVATNVANETLVSNKEYMRYLNLNDTDLRKTLDDAIHSAYMIGRKRMAGSISSVLSGTEGNSSRVEHQVTQFLDQLYEAYAGKNDMKNVSATTKSNSSQQMKAKSSFLAHQWSKLKNLVHISDLSTVAAVVKENLHTLYSILDSVWSILKGNVNLMLSIITQVLSLVFVSGTFLLNGIISMVIFLTTLFYLLSASSENYLLVEWFSGVSMGTKLGESVNDAIKDVFGASLKMATFYGLYTWLTHSVFGVNLVFIPSALAATLGVVPFIGTYWAAVPGALEIYLIQKEEILAVLLILLHLLPSYVVDTAIYSEIGGGGHPYLTGLAVAGGIYCFGLEGAIVGPIVLCCLIAAFNVYNGIMGPEDGKERESALSAAAASLWQYKRAMSEDRGKRL